MKILEIFAWIQEGIQLIHMNEKNRLAWILRQLAALVWPVLLGYSEAEPLVQNSHIDPRH